MLHRLIVTKESLFRKMDEYLSVNEEIKREDLLNSMLLGGMKNIKDDIVMNIVAEMKEEFYDICTCEKYHKSVDLAKFLKEILIKYRFDLDCLFHYNLSNTKSKDRIDTFQFFKYQNTVISYFQEQIKGSMGLIGGSFNDFFFEEYYEYIIYCLSNEAFVDLIYSDCKKEAKNTLNNINRVAALNYYVINYKEEVLKSFKPIREEMERRMTLGLDYTDIDELIKGIEDRTNIFDFDIDKDGNLVYESNKEFYEDCELIINKFKPKHTKLRTRKIQDEFTKDLEQNKEQFIEVGTFRVWDFTALSQYSVNNIKYEYFANIEAGELKAASIQELFLLLLNRSKKYENARIRIFACNFNNMIGQRYYFIFNDGVHEENQHYIVAGLQLCDNEDNPKMKLSYNVDENLFGFNLEYMLKHCTKEYEYYLLQKVLT